MAKGRFSEEDINNAPFSYNASRVSGGANCLRSGLTLFPAHYQVIDRLLTELIQKALANFVMLTDVTGQVVAAKGDQAQVDLIALGSLMAGDLAASQEIGRLTGEYQNYQLILREGQQIHTLISEAGSHLALLALVSQQVPLGWVRMLIRQTAQHLAEITMMPAPEVEPFDPDIKDDLSRLLSDALDDIWQE